MLVLSMKKLFWKKIIKRTLVLIPIFIVVFLIFNLFGSPPLHALFGISGPTAGVTRALTQFIRGNFRASFAYHPLAVPLFFVFIFSLYHDLLPIKKKVSEFIFIISGVLTFAFFIYRLLAYV